MKPDYEMPKLEVVTPLEVAVYLNVENIVKDFPNPDPAQIIDLNNTENVQYSMPGYPLKVIDVTGKSAVAFTLSNDQGSDGNCFWLTTFDTEKNGPIVSGPTANPIGNNYPPNVITLEIKQDIPKKEETQSFTLHCYFVYFDQTKKKNLVYHCSIDPKLKAKQEQ